MAIKVTRVEENSVAAGLGIQVDDEIISIDERPIRDIIDFRFHTAQDVFVLRLKKTAADGHAGETWDLNLELDGEDLGLEIEDFRNKGCNNKCIFCFCDQLPPSARSTLLFKDDDFRLSFLHGNYITLTNMRMKEIDRVIEQRLSPLYVSVHATDMAVRNRMLGRTDDGGFWEKFEKLVHGGIMLHTQVVLCPGYNDGPVLKQTIFDLYRYYPGVATQIKNRLLQNRSVVVTGTEHNLSVQHDSTVNQLFKLLPEASVISPAQHSVAHCHVGRVDRDV